MTTPWFPTMGRHTETPMDLAHTEAPKVDDNSALAQLDAEEKPLDDAAKAAELNEAMAACNGGEE